MLLRVKAIIRGDEGLEITVVDAEVTDPFTKYWFHFVKIQLMRVELSDSIN
jgi:hypothetical protein